MIIQLEQADIEAIAQAVIKQIRPLLTGRTESAVEVIIFDVKCLCEYLHVTPKWLYERTSLKEIPFIKLSGKQLRFRKKDIDKWLDTLGTPVIEQYKGRPLRVVR
jgi:excisionase family DNA binding protein